MPRCRSLLTGFDHAIPGPTARPKRMLSLMERQRNEMVVRMIKTNADLSNEFFFMGVNKAVLVNTISIFAFSQ